MSGPASAATESCDPTAEASRTTDGGGPERTAATCSARSIGGAYASSSAAATTIPMPTIGSIANSRQCRRSSATS